MLGIKKDDASKTARTKEVRAWVREDLKLADEVSVMVTELTCSEPGCPPVETVIAVLKGPGESFQVKIPRSVLSLAREDVALALARGESK